jgi:hypothetical protein
MGAGAQGHCRTAEEVIEAAGCAGPPPPGVGKLRKPKITIAKAALAAAALIAVIAAAVFAVGCGSDKKKSSASNLQTVSFQKPEDTGADPFTPPADVEGDDEVDVPASATPGEQPFGGSGSNRVCDRDKLIRFLKRNPERMREWARVLGVRQTFRAVKRYIAKLHPVTLTRDTQVTNHAFKNGRAVPFQAILQAGTAVLVDKYGTPVVRCFCGNPLGPAVFVPTAKCLGCPPHYKPPKQCRYGHKTDYDETYYRRDYYSNGDYDDVFIRRHRSSAYSKCYEPYPDPPTVRIVDLFEPPPPPPEPVQTQTTPAPAPAQPAPEPSGGLQCDPPRSQLEAEQCAELQGNAPQTAPTPQPETQPDVCHDGQDNEGVPGLIDGDDPNCQ